MDATTEPDAPTPGTLRADVWLALYAAPDGLTDSELDEKLNVGARRIPPLVWRSRRGELTTDGAVLDSGRTRGGETVWVARRRAPALEAPPPPPLPSEPPPMPEATPQGDNRPTVLLIDGKNLLYRALMSKGEPVDQDFPRRLRELYERYAPTFAIVAWDAEGPTWRHAAYPDYKAQRDAPSAYEKQVYAQVPGWSTQCGYQFTEAPGWEADDIIGTYTSRLREAHRVVIVSNDKDMTQLLGPGVIMLKGWNEVITHDDVVKPSPEGWGVPCRFIPDLLAIMGDSSDNIPGVPKVGEKGAEKLINLFGGVEAIIEAAKSGKDKAKGRAERIVQFADALRLFKRLTTISCGIADLAAPVPCSTMVPQAPGKRVAPDGMTVLDGVLYPLPETAHMAKALGWRWSNPTAMPERKQSQLRPGEPIERWEHEGHWGYLVERGGQWTIGHRGIDGEVETGKEQLAHAFAEFRAYHVAYCAMAHAIYGKVLINVDWSTDAPIVALDNVSTALADARATLAAEHARLLAGPTSGRVQTAEPNPPGNGPHAAPASFPVIGTPEQRAVLHAQVDALPPGIGAVEMPSGIRLTGVELGTPDGAVSFGGIEFPEGVAPGLEAGFVEIRVDLAGPTHIEAPPMLPPRAPDLPSPPLAPVVEPSPPTAPALSETQAAVAAAYGVDPSTLPPPPAPPSAPAEPQPVWRIPVTEGETTIPFGYARVIVALTLEAFTGKPQVLTWDVDLKTDLGTPPDDPSDPNGFLDGRWSTLLDRLQGKVAEMETDPGARTSLGVVVRNVRGVKPFPEAPIAVVLDLDPVLVNIARIANGAPPVGRWFFNHATDYARWTPRVERNAFMDGIPF